jgi:sirohydrochlorin ferrochelatase
LVLLAHGSRDPRSASTVRGLAAGVAARRAGPVSAGFLDFNLPTAPSVLRAYGVASPDPVVAVPLLLTSAYHGRIDVPAAVATARVPVRMAPVLGPVGPGQPPDPLLLAALRQRLSEVDTDFDGVVLLAAGTTDLLARSTVEVVAAALGADLGRPCRAGYASGSPVTAAVAVADLRRRGVGRIVAASYFLAPGRLHDRALASARSAGGVGASAPLGAADDLVRLVIARADTAGVEGAHVSAPADRDPAGALT